MKLLLWQESPWFADPCPVDAVDNCTEGVGIPDSFAGKGRPAQAGCPSRAQGPPLYE